MTFDKYRRQYPGHVIFRVTKSGQTRVIAIPDRHALKRTKTFPNLRVRDLDGVHVSLDPKPIQGVPARPSPAYYERKRNAK